MQKWCHVEISRSEHQPYFRHEYVMFCSNSCTLMKKLMKKRPAFAKRKKSFHPCKNCWGPDVKSHYSLFISEGSAVKNVNQVVLCGLGCSTWLFYRLMLLVLSQHVIDQYKSNSYQYRTKLLDKEGAYYDLYTMYIYTHNTQENIKWKIVMRNQY